MRRFLLAAAFSAVCLAGGCKSQGFKLQDAVDSLLGDIDGIFGTSSLPGKQLQVIRDVHEQKSWTFREGVDEPLERTRGAVRALRTCDYASWTEAALVVEILSSMADEHPSALVRAEALDSITHIASWTLNAVPERTQPATSAEMIEGVKVLKLAIDKNDSDAAFTFQVATAVNALANYPFDRVELAPGASDNKTVARAYGSQLRTARGALRSINGKTLEGFQGDATVHEALDRAYVSLSAAVIRLTLLKAALGDASDTTRVAALRDVALLAPDGGPAVLRAILLHDQQASVRREAARSLASYPLKDSVPALLDGLADEMVEVRGASAQSLEKLTGQTFGDDRAAWVRWWNSNATPASTPEAGKQPTR